ncbi:hypothetical protein HDU93_007854 [Gonapodya sp. JEL0774]|nr:hypothetical protein HDU93_007854 [Gonapodya sp. JEL0774]
MDDPAQPRRQAHLEAIEKVQHQQYEMYGSQSAGESLEDPPPVVTTEPPPAIAASTDGTTPVVTPQKASTITFRFDGQTVQTDRDADFEFHIEDHMILRLPPGKIRDTVKKIVRDRKDENLIKLRFHNSRQATFSVGTSQHRATLQDLPCIIESQITPDKKTLYKVADISQILVVEPEGPFETWELERKVPAAREQMKAAQEAKYVHLDGLTPPMRRVKIRRFRKRLVKKMTYESIEQEVIKLLEEDAKSLTSRWEWTDYHPDDFGPVDSYHDGDPTTPESYAFSQSSPPDLSASASNPEADGDADGDDIDGEEDLALDIERELEKDLNKEDEAEEEDDDDGSSVAGGEDGKGSPRRRGRRPEEDDDWEDLAQAEGEGDVDGEDGEDDEPRTSLADLLGQLSRFRAELVDLERKARDKQKEMRETRNDIRRAALARVHKDVVSMRDGVREKVARLEKEVEERKGKKKD